MTPFIRFPHTPHLVWLGSGSPRDDKVLTPAQAEGFLQNPIVIEEKIDGANTGFSFDGEGTLQVQNRGEYLIPPYLGQYVKLEAWLRPRLDLLFDTLGDRFILFGEWCFARHNLEYTRLPDWFLAFDVFDRRRGLFLPSAHRNLIAAACQVQTIDSIGANAASISDLTDLVMKTRSHYREGELEGLILRIETADCTVDRAKIVRPDFVQAIGPHWSRSALQRNRLS